MPTFSALPADLTLAFVPGDEFTLGIDLSIDGTGFSWTAIVYEVAPSYQNGVAVASQGATAATFAVEVTNAALGQLVLSLTEAQTAPLLPTKSYRWYFRGVSPGTVTRTYLSGVVSPTSP
jgi:hypothetical protein